MDLSSAAAIAGIVSAVAALLALAPVISLLRRRGAKPRSRVKLDTIDGTRGVVGQTNANSVENAGVGEHRMSEILAEIDQMDHLLRFHFMSEDQDHQDLVALNEAIGRMSDEARKWDEVYPPMAEEARILERRLRDLKTSTPCHEPHL